MASESEFTSENEFVVTHTVDRGQTGLRLDSFLQQLYKKRSRESLKRAIASGAILIERNQSPHLMLGHLKPSTQLQGGDQVLVVSERTAEPEVDFNYQVLLEDEDLLVINKPGNLPVHPAGRFFFNTLLVHLRTEGFRKALHAEREYFLAHRIDRETSGILVLAKKREVCADLVAQFAERKTEKKYLAIVRGHASDEVSVRVPMGKAIGSRVELKMALLPESLGGMSAWTDVRCLKRLKRQSPLTQKEELFSLVECRPKTGRQHQIRVHLESIGHPIVGDKLYGLSEEEAYRYFESKFISPEAEARLILPRHALHACSIRLVHPTTRNWIEIVAPLPPDLQSFLDSLSDVR